MPPGTKAIHFGSKRIIGEKVDNPVQGHLKYDFAVRDRFRDDSQFNRRLCRDGFDLSCTRRGGGKERAALANGLNVMRCGLTCFGRKCF
jgi:hypothetical protein